MSRLEASLPVDNADGPDTGEDATSRHAKTCPPEEKMTDDNKESPVCGPGRGVSE